MGVLTTESKDKKIARYTKLLKSKFIFLNVYCRNVKEEHDPRGPDGPYQFIDRSVPVLVLKRWDGKTLVQQLGFVADKKRGVGMLQSYIDKALKENGPVVPPKALRPLLKSWTKATEHFAKKRLSSAIPELQKIMKAVGDRKKFPEMPDVGTKAATKLAELKATATELIATANKIEDPKQRRITLGKIQRDYGRIKEVRIAVRKALAAIPK